MAKILGYQPGPYPTPSDVFDVGVMAPGIGGGGRLWVGPNLLVCVLGPVARRITGITSVQHLGTVVHVYRARLIPFWFNVTARIDDGSSYVLAGRSWFGLRGLIRALTESGFTVELHRTWFFQGLSFSESIGRGAPAGMS
jgi:hypothetical protein